nr:GT-D fold domain-containing glycosyltransferase [Streptococcus uberis]
MKEITVFNIEKSLEHILNNKSSVARFGDGEIDIIAGNSIPYQDYDRELANQLKKNHLSSIK